MCETYSKGGKTRPLKETMEVTAHVSMISLREVCYLIKKSVHFAVISA